MKSFSWAFSQSSDCQPGDTPKSSPWSAAHSTCSVSKRLPAPSRRPGNSFLIAQRAFWAPSSRKVISRAPEPSFHQSLRDPQRIAWTDPVENGKYGNSLESVEWATPSFWIGSACSAFGESQCPRQIPWARRSVPFPLPFRFPRERWSHRLRSERQERGF